jgi:hypothetical protein
VPGVGEASDESLAGRRGSPTMCGCRQHRGGGPETSPSQTHRSVPSQPHSSSFTHSVSQQAFIKHRSMGALPGDEAGDGRIGVTTSRAEAVAAHRAGEAEGSGTQALGWPCTGERVPRLNGGWRGGCDSGVEGTMVIRTFSRPRTGGRPGVSGARWPPGSSRPVP